MKQKYLHDQRGVAMLLEIVLVTAVLGLVAVAVYQSNHRPAPKASVSSTPAPAGSTAGLAASAAAIATQDAATDAAISAEADVAAGEVTSADDDAAKLGGTLDANAF